ncbi:hypothetical protein SAY86_006971 [Trapa natans]|uniref:F-box domain-containing protein n=1 Tax=Trapa natans TaxID=22666 RepID=A0AAN7KZT6_TRANT|nr:hypothetical protein SAY86_006971 [Trapa natans]
MRTMSQKWRKKNCKSEDEEDKTTGVSFRCLTLYGRGGGCKVGADTDEECGDPSSRRRSNASEEGSGGIEYGTACGPDEIRIGVDCFSHGVKERFRRRNNRRVAELDEAVNKMHLFLPDDILEMCLVRLPLTSLMNARLVCKKWRRVTSTPRFMQIRREGLYQSPWIFLFGAVKDGYCSGEVHALDVSQDRWHKVETEFLKGRFMFSVISVMEDVYVVGGCSSLTNFGRLDRSSFKTHRGVFAFRPMTKSWWKMPAMKYARSAPILGACEVSLGFLPGGQSHHARQDRRTPRTRLGGVSDVYEDPHRLSVRRQNRNTFDENEHLSSHYRKPNNSAQEKSEQMCTRGAFKRFIMIAVGGLGTWDEPLYSGEIYDSASNKWTQITQLPLDLGIVCSGTVCSGVFYVYSENDRLAGYDLEKGYWIQIQTGPFPPRVHEYYPKVVSCNERLFMLLVSWCEGDGQIGQRNKAVRKLWELDLAYLKWKEVSVHPDAPMDWNASFVGDRGTIFGVEMFKIFGQLLDFITVWDASATRPCWRRVSMKRMSQEVSASSCVTKTMAAVYL